MVQIIPNKKTSTKITSRRKIIICQKITASIIFAVLAGFMIYFTLISEVTGDPFAKF
jgi:hypothetical protein